MKKPKHVSELLRAQLCLSNRNTRFSFESTLNRYIPYFKPGISTLSKFTMVHDLYSNQNYDNAEVHLATPDAKFISIKDPDEIRRRLDAIQSPFQRLKELYISILRPEECPTHEGKYIRKVFTAGFFSGVLYGALLNAKSEHQRYFRKHNAAVFEGKYVGWRHVHDTLLPALAARGLKYGVRVSALAGGASMVAFGSITYRNDIYLPDWIVGFTVYGGLTRLWLGSKAVLFGAVVGSITGAAAYGLAKSYELAFGNIASIRRDTHALHMAGRELEVRRNINETEKNIQEKLREMG